MKHLLLIAALICATMAPSIEAQTSAPQPSKRVPRRLVYGAIGAAFGAGAAAFYISAKDDGVTPGLCSQESCVITFSLGLGTLVGFMVGREFDQLHALRYRGRMALRPPEVSVSLSGEPILLVARDSLVVAGGPGGLQVFRSRDRLVPAGTRAAGIRGISALDLAPGSSSVIVGSTSGVYVYPPQTGPGFLVREGESAALAAADGRIFLGTGSRIEIAPVNADTTGGWPGIETGGRIATLAWDSSRGLLWAIVDSLLVAYRPAGDSLDRVGALAIGPAARRIAVSGNRIAIASGEGGVRMIDASDPAQPSHRWHWTDARYVYDVSLSDQRLYVAAGVEGVFVLDVAGPAPTVLGLARDLGFATALASSNGQTFVLDRGVNTLRRFQSNF